MKKILLNCLIIMFLAFLLVGCEDDSQPSTYGWIVSEGMPTHTTGVVPGQMYLDTETYDLYQFKNGYWSFVGNIKSSEEDKEMNNFGGTNELRYYMNSINHRGYCHEAPENTLSAYRLSALKGFKFVECDILFTKDNIPVLLHDETIDRTSNGSGKINNLTYDEASKYDYSYDSEHPELEAKFTAYRGEKIPKFEEFIALCKALELHPYIEIKGTISELQAQILMNIVTKYGMKRNVSWISFDTGALYKIVCLDSKARIGWVLSTMSQVPGEWNHIDNIDRLITGENQVFVDIYYTNASSIVADLCISKGVALEVWCIDQKNKNALFNLHPYVTGVSSNDMNAGEELKENALNK